MRALLLAAGFGTRLGDLSDELPKPLLPVCDLPLIRYGVALLAGHGIREIAINLHHRGDLIEAELGDGRALGVELHYSHEPSILGTGGAIRRIEDWLTEGGRASFVVMNAKIVIDLELDAVLRLHRESDAAATLVLRETADATRWGAIECDEANRVTRILNEGAPGSHVCMFTGVHAIHPRLVARLPEGNSDSIRQAYLPALRAGDRISAHLLSGYFHEHSTPARYLAGNANLLRGKAALRYPPGPLTGVEASARVADSALLTGPHRIGAEAVIEPQAVIGPDVVVGRRARVAAGVHLERVVLWPDTVVTADLRDAIVTPRGVHPVETAT